MCDECAKLLCQGECNNLQNIAKTYIGIDIGELTYMSNSNFLGQKNCSARQFLFDCIECICVGSSGQMQLCTSICVPFNASVSAKASVAQPIVYARVAC